MSVSSSIFTEPNILMYPKPNIHMHSQTNSLMYSPFIHIPPVCQKKTSQFEDNQTGVDVFVLDNILDEDDNNDVLLTHILPWRQEEKNYEEPVLSIQANDTTIYSQSFIDLGEEHHRQVIKHRPSIDVREEIRRKECLDYFNNEDHSSCSLSVSRSHCAFLIKQLAKAKSDSGSSILNNDNFDRFELENHRENNQAVTEIDENSIKDIPETYLHDHEHYFIQRSTLCDDTYIPDKPCRTCIWVLNSDFDEIPSNICNIYEEDEEEDQNINERTTETNSDMNIL